MQLSPLTRPTKKDSGQTNIAQSRFVAKAHTIASSHSNSRPSRANASRSPSDKKPEFGVPTQAVSHNNLKELREETQTVDIISQQLHHDSGRGRLAEARW